MPDAIITSTASTFGTISGTFAADQSTVTGTVTGIVAGTLSGSVGVPGPAGAGVPAGGTAGQYLQKIDGTNYNTDWVTLNLSGYAPLASPAFTGNPTAPTAALGDNDTSLATTAFVQQEILSGTANAKNLEVYVRNQTGSTLAAGAIVYVNGATGNRPTVTLAQANNDANSAQTMGFVKTAIANNGFGYVIVRGECEGLDTSAVSEGAQLYLSPTTAGAYTTTKPSAPQHLVYVGIVIRSHPTQGVILVAVQNGYELHELHDVSITSPTNGQVLKYNSTTGLWYNGTDSAGVAWGGITGTLSSQTDLQTALDGKYSTTNPAGYITSAALSPYLTSATAASIYAPLAGATFTGLVAFNGATGSISTKTPGWYKSYASGAENTDFTLQYESGFQVNVGGTAVARIASSGILAPSAGITFSDATTQTTAGISAATAASTYYPLTGNPSGFLTSSALTPYAPLAGSTFTGKVNTVASTTTTAGLNIPHGVAPTSPVNGDIWTTTGNVFVRLNGGTQALANIGGNNVFTNANNTFGNSTATGTIGLASGATISGSTKTVNIGTGGVAGSTTNIAIGSTTGTSTTTLQGTTNGVTAAVDTNSVALATTAFVVGQAGSATPLVDGTAAVGTSLRYARQDHVHPTDTSRAALVSPAFTGTPTAPTATAGTNTTQIATTAFVTAAVPTFATNTQARVGSSTTLGINPNNLQAAVMSPNWSPVYRIGFTATASGTGANVTLGSTNTFYQLPTTGAVSGHAYARTFGTSQVDQLTNLWGDDGNIYVNFAKRIWMSGRSLLNFPNEAVYTARVSFGKAEATGVGDLAARGIGWRYSGGASNFVQLMVHNGTTLTTVNSSFHPTGVAFDWDIVSAGDGNVTLFINGSSVATTSAGPSTRATSGQCLYQEEIGLTATSTGNFLRFYCARGAIYVQP